MTEVANVKRMTSFKFTDYTRDKIARIRDARNKAIEPHWYAGRLTNTDVIRQLLEEECLRLDEQDLAALIAEEKRVSEEVKKEATKKVAKKTTKKKAS